MGNLVFTFAWALILITSVWAYGMALWAGIVGHRINDYHCIVTSSNSPAL